MKIPTFFSMNVSANTLVLSESESHHAFHVLRLRTTDECCVIDAQGHKVRGKVNRDREIDVLERLDVPRPFGQMSWMVSLVGLEDLKQIVQAATFLGIFKIYVVHTQFSQSGVQESEKIMDKLQRVILSAQKVASIPYQPELIFSDLDKVLKQDGNSLVVFHQNGDRTVKPSRNGSVLCFGPEGGFSDSEIAQFKNHGAHVISLGDVNYPSTLVPIIATARLCS